MSSHENCALDEHGNLMEASQIAFFHSPSDARPISGPFDLEAGAAEPPSPSPAPKLNLARPQHNSNRAKFHEALAASKLDSDIDKPQEIAVPSTSKATTSRNRNRKQSESDNETVQKKKKPGPKIAIKKRKPAIKSTVQLFLKPIDKSHGQPDTNTTSASPLPTTTTPLSEDTQVKSSACDDGNTKVTVSVSVTAGSGQVKGIADILTFCDEKTKPTQTATGLYDCHVCR